MSSSGMKDQGVFDATSSSSLQVESSEKCQVLVDATTNSEKDYNIADPIDDIYDNKNEISNYLLTSVDENISFTATKRVRIKVRNLSIGSSISGKESKLPLIGKRKSKDIESNDSINPILYPMSFDISANSLTCIVGGSGSGKTTLLNSLAGRSFNKNSIFQTGEIRYNNDISLEKYRHAYVIQQDILPSKLTCFETLMYSAELKLPKLTSREERKQLVNEIILTLGLKECKNTLVGDKISKGLSGGERRRLSVGLQLISNPSILFLDEPTTGLDNYNAYLLCKSFQHLAKRLNKTIIMSIHQPRSDIFKLFDNVLILSKGRLCYGDSYKYIFEHFSSLGYTMPELKVNPADYFVDITSIDTRTRKLEEDSTKRVAYLTASWKQKMQDLNSENNEKISTIDDIDFEESENEVFQDVGRAPFWRELGILCRRNLRLQYRDPIGWFSIIFESLFLGLICGWLFFKPGESVSGLRSTEAALYTSSSLQSYLYLLGETYRLCQNDLKLFDRERMEKCCSVPGFLIARRITKMITEDFWIVTVFSVTTYFMYGLRLDSSIYFWKYFAGNLIFHLNTISFATFASAISRDVAIATLIGNLNFTFQSMTNGLFVNAKELPVYVRWCKYIAYLWYSFGYFISNQFSNYKSQCSIENQGNPNVNEICYQYSGEYIIKSLGFWENWSALPICVVLAFAIGHYVAAGMVFYFKPLDMSMGKEIKTSDAIDNSIDYAKKSEDIKLQQIQKNDQSNDPITLRIKDINLSVSNKLKKSNKVILNNVNALFEAGKLNVIMGPSGSGKTSLLNLISGRLSSSLFTSYTSSGDIYLDNLNIQDYNLVRPVCSYVVQEDDHLLSGLSVRETLRYAARLRLPKANLTMHDQHIIVDDIILKMGLKDCANTLVGNEIIKGISGGEKRRLSIAIQLLSSPKILFLDEPTSGLDSFTAASIVECLENLAKSGTTVIMTIHQPRSLEKFGSILLLAKGGKVAFDGKESDMIPYFDKLGYSIPKLTNVADFIIDLISYNTSTAEIEEITKKRVNYIIHEWENHSTSLQMVPENTRFVDSKSEVRAAFKAIIKEKADFSTGFWVMLSRQWLGLIRDKNILIARTTQIIGMAVIYSLFFARLKYNTTSIQNRLGLCQQVTALYFTGMLNNLSSYPQERDYFYDEYDDDVVGLNSFFFSYLIIELPFEIFSCLIFAVFLVFVIGFQTSAKLFFTITYGCFMIVNAGESLGISFNTLFRHPGFALNMISIFCSVGVSMAGLLAMTLDSFLRAINYLSPTHYCVMLISNQVFTSSLKFTCNENERLSNGQCLFSNGKQVLDEYNMQVNMELYYILIAVVTIIQRAISWGFLKVRLTKINIKKSK